MMFQIRSRHRRKKKKILVRVVHNGRPKFTGAMALSSPRTGNTKEHFLNLCHEHSLLRADIPFL